MASLVRKAALLLFTEGCMEEYFEKFNFLHGECFKASLSKGLGLGIIAGSLLVKLPQILKVLKNKSGEGINIISVFLDLFAITATVSYSFVSKFPFSSWGDGVFLGIQTAAIAALVLHYGGNTTKATAFIAAYMSIITAVIIGLVPVHVLWTCQALNVPILLTGKLIQAYTNYSNGSTGQLSAATCFMLFFGSLARIFTSVQETGDTIIIVTYIVATAANALIASQLIYYWNVVPKVAKVSKKKKQ